MNNTNDNEIKIIHSIINNDKKSLNIINFLYYILKTIMYLSLFMIVTALFFIKEIIDSDPIAGNLKFKGIFLLVLFLVFFSYLISDFIQTLVSKYISKNIKIILEDIVEEYYPEISLDDFKNIELTNNENQENFLEMGYLYGKKTSYDFYNASNYFTIKNNKKSTTFSNVKALALGDMNKYTNDVNESMSFDGMFFCNSFTDKNSKNFKVTAFIFNISNIISYILLVIFISIPFILELFVESLNSLVIVISIIIMSFIFFYFSLFKGKSYQKDDSENIDITVKINDNGVNSKEISKEIVDFVNKNKVRIYASGAKNKNNLLVYKKNDFFRVISKLSDRNSLSYLQDKIILIRDSFKLNAYIREKLSDKEE